MFNELNLQNFDSLIDKCRMDFQRQVPYVTMASYNISYICIWFWCDFMSGSCV